MASDTDTNRFAECDDCGMERPVSDADEPVGPCLCDFDGTEPTAQDRAERRAGITREEYRQMERRARANVAALVADQEGDDGE